MNEVWYVPDLGRDLFSVHKATERGLTVELRTDLVNIHEKGQFRATGYW